MATTAAACPWGVSRRSWRRTRRRFGLYPQKGTIAVGSDADLVIVDLEAEHTVADDATAAHSDFSIFEGMTFNGWPVMTIARGEIIADSGRLVGTPGRGRYLRREVAGPGGV